MTTRDPRTGDTAQAEFVPIDRSVVQKIAEDQRVDIRKASIREMSKLVDAIERESGIRFIRMEFGIPGLPVPEIAIAAETRALREGQVGNVYAPFDGVPALKQEAARFAKLFMNLDLPASSCIPTVGAMQGCFASLLLASRMRAGRKTVLCLEPGFPVNLLQLRLLGLGVAKLDFYDYRGEALVAAIEEQARGGELCAVLWSSPNNPSWINLNESELAGLARICDEYGLLAIEDLAYFGMDTREDYLTPGRPPYQPTVMRYTDNAICIVSSSKMFSYAGQRISMAFLSPDLMASERPDLLEHYGTAKVGHAFVHGGLYPVTASVPQSPQYGLQALLEAANAGDPSVFRPAAEYARRAGLMKACFLKHGFRLVYDRDLDAPIADGFYFTIAYPGYENGADLLRDLLHYGVSAITLETTGSNRVEGLRACVSLIEDAQIADLDRRLRAFGKGSELH